MSDEAARWREGRREAAQAHADALRRKQQAESSQARALIDEFVAEARRLGPDPEPLRARTYDGRARYRTPLTGWYLRFDETLAIDADGLFYVLRTPPSLVGRVRGVVPEPSDPPLVLGAGGKDGESIDLRDALDRIRARRV
ncbi:hypothetical protein [Cellulomonas gilvus]|uniref:Uncharacterized protein n=1 Tax=Cellulomonas gilvus (strain ATCC 13127 / NRRL B-14078) TaxID=593907 RepID=F8A1Z7_CELGA|nr:hypothetical protein [Cellulomonas gilvus]AEI12941.1 hypothetical protein Celgi_2442 [Cellulomonas gilvus ATCC 13127]